MAAKRWTVGMSLMAWSAFAACVPCQTGRARIDVRVLNFDVPQINSEPAGISADGSRVVVNGPGAVACYDVPSRTYTFIARPAGSTWATAVAISGDGTVVIGTAMITENDEGGVPRSRRRIWTSVNGEPANFISIHPAFPNYSCFDVNQDGMLIGGWFYDASNVFQHSFRYNVLSGAYFDLVPPNGWAGAASSLTDDGSIMAGSVTQGNGYRAAVWLGNSHLPQLLPQGAFSSDGVSAISGDGRWVAQQGPASGLGYTAFIYDRSTDEYLEPGVFGDIRPDSLRQIESVEGSPGGFVAVGADQSMTPARWGPGQHPLNLWTLFHDRVPECSTWWWMTVQAMSKDGRFIVGQRGASGAGASAWVVDLGCLADIDGDGFLTGLDFDAFVRAFEAGDSIANYDTLGGITGMDFDAFVQDFESGC